MAVHTITAADAVDNYNQYLTGQRYVEGYSLQVNGELHAPSALDALAIIEDGMNIKARADFVRTLLKGCAVAVSLYGEQVAEFTVTDGFQWFAVPEFQKNPQALKFVVSSIYGVFLKNSVPHLTESQLAVKQKMEQTA